MVRPTFLVSLPAWETSHILSGGLGVEEITAIITATAAVLAFFFGYGIFRRGQRQSGENIQPTAATMGDNTQSIPNHDETDAGEREGATGGGPDEAGVSRRGGGGEEGGGNIPLLNNERGGDVTSSQDRPRLHNTYTNDQLDELSKHIPSRSYTTFADKIGIDYNEAINIFDGCHDYIKANRKCLAKWKDVSPETRVDLVEALDKSQLGSLVRYLK